MTSSPYSMPLTRSLVLLAVPRSPLKPTPSRSMPSTSIDSGQGASPESALECRAQRVRSSPRSIAFIHRGAPSMPHAPPARAALTRLALTYGAPGETDEQWRQSIEAALTADPTHISAYSLIVEQGTRMARQVSSGALFPADDDVLAHRYLMADDAFTDAGLEWYEVSNWARGGVDGSSFCRHNMGYWHNDDWWGVGPGAHSHVGNYRWWNHKHPGRCSASLAEGELPIAGSEALSQSDRELEDVMLRLRLAEGLPLDRVNSGQRHRVQELASDGLLDESQLTRGQLVLTRNGRLLADLVVRTLT